MQYGLGISFLYEKYHRPARLRIFCDDRLVDEITLYENINLRCVNLGNKLKNLKVKFAKKHKIREDVDVLNTTDIQFLPEKTFLYKVDDNFLTKNIRIECHNPNNNHTNGFMSKYSYVQFKRIFLCPMDLLNRTKYLEQFQKNKKMDMETSDNWPMLGPGFKLDANLGTDQWHFTRKSTWFGSPRNLYDLKVGGDFCLTIPLLHRDGYICTCADRTKTTPGMDENMFEYLRTLAL